MSNLHIEILNDSSPYQDHQGAYEINSFDADKYPGAENIESLMTVSPEIEKSYIQQNLPVRRQSLIVYHDRMRCQDDQDQDQDKKAPKRHSSMYISSYDHKKYFVNTRLPNSKPLNMVHAITYDERQKNIFTPAPLRINILHNNDIQDKCFTSSSTDNSSSSSSSSDYTAEALIRKADFETLSFQQKKPPSSPTKFIGFLRPSKSDTSHSFKSKKRSCQPNSSQDDLLPTANNWPLSSKLKSVFSRLQPNNSENNRSENITKKKKKKTVTLLETPIKKKRNQTSVIYTALLSHVSKEFLKRMQLTTVVYKDDIEYCDVFDGRSAVNCILDILNTTDRNLALLVGRALESQGFFHHVNYDYRLRDLSSELYQFQYIHNEISDFYTRPPIPPQFTSKLLSSRHPTKRYAPSVCETLPINGIFSILTDCYSPTCTRKKPCYSVSCPRNITQEKKSIVRPFSSHFLRSAEHEHLRSLWRHSVPLNVVLGTNDIEQKRQECIYELIYTEQDFTKDLQYVQDFWVEPILSGDIIPIERRSEFVTDVFWNLLDIERISSALSKDLTLRQDKHSVIPCIGDILLNHVKGFQPFVIYGAHQIIGKHKYELEKKRNLKFLQFAEKLERQPESRRLELNGYLTKPTSRLGRYNLLLNTIHQLTPKDHDDYIDIPKAMDMITDFLVHLNKKVGLSNNVFHLEQLSERILPIKESTNLDLLNPSRQLIIRGKMKRYHENTLQDVQVFLFDHCMVFCKIKHQDEIECYKMFQKPIPLDSLNVFIPASAMAPLPSSSTHTTTSKSLTTTTSNIYSKISSNTFHSSVSSLSTNETLANGFPIMLQHENDAISLLASTESTRKLWHDKIIEVQEQLLNKETV